MSSGRRDPHVDGSALASVGAVLAVESRAMMLAALMDGRAHTGRELAAAAGIAVSTASEHLSTAIDAGLVVMEPSGRHRYFRLANVRVAHMLEAIGATPVPVRLPRSPVGLASLRTCYDHMAGATAVRIHDRITGCDYVSISDGGHLELTASGESWFRALGVATTSPSRRPLLRPCLDWTERRHHLGGAIAAGMLDRFLQVGWVERRQKGRGLRMTERGRIDLGAALGLAFER